MTQLNLPPPSSNAWYTQLPQPLRLIFAYKEYRYQTALALRITRRRAPTLQG